MATKLTKPVTRVTTVKDSLGIPGEVTVTICEEGVTFSKKKRKLLSIPWIDIGKLACIPDTAPSKYINNPIGWLIELDQK